MLCLIPRTVTIIITATVFAVNILVDVLTGFYTSISMIIFVIGTTHRRTPYVAYFLRMVPPHWEQWAVSPKTRILTR